MKTRFFILRIIFLINLFSCNGQEKKVVSNQETPVISKDSISKYFNDVNTFYFDHEKKIILSTSLIENVGKFTIYYFPVTNESLDYCNNFENNNKIKPLYDELNSAYYYSDKDRLQIQKTLQNKTKSEKEFKIIGSFVPIQYIQVENLQEYNITFPYTIEYYQEKNNKWIHLSAKKISTAEEDIEFNSKNNLFAIDTNKNSTEQSKLNNDAVIIKELKSIKNEGDLGSLIFYKIENNLKIREDILSFIQKNTTPTENKYSIALQQYVTNQIIQFYDEKKSQWNEEQLIKIIAFASNTTDPLHKKYWKKSPENWHEGMWGNILSFCYLVYPNNLWPNLQKQFKKENYYNLPYLKEMTSYATEFDKFGPP